MGWRAHHDWHVGATVNGAQLATCAHCECLRVTLPVQLPDGRALEALHVVDDRTDEQRAADGDAGPPASVPSVYYIRRIADEGERVRNDAPPCVSPAVGFHPPW